MHQIFPASEKADDLAVILPPLYEIFWSALVLLIVLLLVGKFALPKIYRTTDERQAKIAEGLAAVEKAKEDQALIAREHAQALVEASTKAHEIRERAGEEAEGIIATARTEARKEANRIPGGAQYQILAEKQAAEISLCADVGLLATELAGKIVGEHLADTALMSHAIDRFLGDPEEDNLSASESATR